MRKYYIIAMIRRIAILGRPVFASTAVIYHSFLFDNIANVIPMELRGKWNSLQERLIQLLHIDRVYL
jgi:hypothetical protein